MNVLLDSCWRAAAYCLHPRVIALSLLPLVLMVALAVGLGYFFWDPALDWVRQTIDSWSLLAHLWSWLEGMGMGNLKAVLAPLLVIIAITPLIVLFSLLAVALLMTPALVALVAERRFAQLERRKGGSLLVSVVWSLGSTLLAILALVVSMPLWLVPPLILLLPPLIWGWLTYRVMAFDALAEHASRDERRQILRDNRTPLLAIGVITGYLGAAPSILWASGAFFIVFAPFLIPLAIWIYTLVFAFSSLWFTHYCLAALHKLRADAAATPPPLAPFTSVTPVPLALADEQRPDPPEQPPRLA
jgi:hypothetical protein